MSNKIIAGEWSSFPGEAGVEADHAIPVPSSGRVDVSVRCSEGATLYAVDGDGTLIFLDQGDRFSWSGELVGFTAVSISAQGAGHYRALFVPTGDPVDPVPVAIVDTFTEQDATRLMMRQELAAFLRRSQVLADGGVDAEDLVAELEEDLDLELDDEEDLGAGFMEDFEEGLAPRGAEAPPASSSPSAGTSPPGAESPAGAPSPAVSDSSPSSGSGG